MKDQPHREAAPALRYDPAHPREIECEIHRAISSHPDVEVSSLTVHRIAPGRFCLEGSVRIGPNGPDAIVLASCVAGVDEVLNRLVVHEREFLPPKG